VRPHGEQRVAAGPRRAARVAKAEAQRRGVAGDEDAGVERVAEQLAARAERELTRLLARPRRRTRPRAGRRTPRPVPNDERWSTRQLDNDMQAGYLVSQLARNAIILYYLNSQLQVAHGPR